MIYLSISTRRTILHFDLDLAIPQGEPVQRKAQRPNPLYFYADNMLTC